MPLPWYISARMLNSLLWWLHDHAFPLEVLVVLFSGLFALYADTVRHFLSLPPQRLSTWVLKARLLSVNSKLFNLCECHNNSFNTLVHIARAFVFMLLLIGLFMGGIFLEVVAIRSANRAASKRRTASSTRTWISRWRWYSSWWFVAGCCCWASFSIGCATSRATIIT